MCFHTSRTVHTWARCFLSITAAQTIKAALCVSNSHELDRVGITTQCSKHLYIRNTLAAAEIRITPDTTSLHTTCRRARELASQTRMSSTRIRSRPWSRSSDGTYNVYPLCTCMNKLLKLLITPLPPPSSLGLASHSQDSTDMPSRQAHQCTLRTQACNPQVAVSLVA